MSCTTTNDSTITMISGISDTSKRRRRKLILHVDLRNTIIVADSVTNIDVDQAINGYLTGVLWGRVVDGRWTWVSREPSLTPPEPDTVTYYKHLERILVRKPSDREQLRIVAGDFTRREIGARFRPYFERYLPMLRWRGGERDDDRRRPGQNSGVEEERNDSGLDSGSSTTSTASSTSGLESDASVPPDGVPTISLTRGGDSAAREHFHYVLPSFVRLLWRLCEEGRDFAVLLRTYGLDARNVLAALRRIVEGGRHPDFPRSRPVQFCPNVGSVERHGDVVKMTINGSLLQKFQRKSLSPGRCDPSARRQTRPTPPFGQRRGRRKRPRLEEASRLAREQPGKSCVRRSLAVEGRFSFGSRLQRGVKELARSLSLYECGRSSCLRRSSIDGGSEAAARRTESTPEADCWITLGDDWSVSEALNDVVGGGVCAFVDDFIHWQNNGYGRLAGKPLWIALPRGVVLGPSRPDQASESASIDSSPREGARVGGRSVPACPLPARTADTHHHVFFDDNIRVGEEEEEDNSIVDVRLYDWERGMWRSSTRREAQLCADVFLVQANLLESLENENYFVEKLERCESNLDRLLGVRDKEASEP